MIFLKFKAWLFVQCIQMPFNNSIRLMSKQKQLKQIWCTVATQLGLTEKSANDLM